MTSESQMLQSWRTTAGQISRLHTKSDARAERKLPSSFACCADSEASRHVDFSSARATLSEHPITNPHATIVQARIGPTFTNQEAYQGSMEIRTPQAKRGVRECLHRAEAS